MKRILPALFLVAACLAQTAPRNYPEPKPGDFTAPGFRFKTGEQLDVRLHYYTLGSPNRDASGRVTNAVLILHGTGGSGRQFFAPYFANQLFGPGQLLDATKYFIVLPDNVGHGGSSKPSDGLHMGFPHYDYDDMVALQHQLLVQGLDVNHLRLVMGTSMGCMHSWAWAETFPDFMDAAMPLACLPVELAGRNRTWRKMLMDAIRSDPAWDSGNYKEEPKQGLTFAEDMLILVGIAPLYYQTQAPTRDVADTLLQTRLSNALKNLDANDLLYQVDSSRSYNPDPRLESIKVPVMAVNSADDFINPPELGILEREIRRVRLGRAVVLPITEQTRGHGTHTWAAIWGSYLSDLLKTSGGLAPGTAWSGAPAAASRSDSSTPPQPSGVASPQGAGGGLGPGPGFTGAYRVGVDVSAPRATYQPDPEYSEEARKAGYQGTVVLFCILGADGRVRDVRVQRALGMGLDEKAVEAVKKWQFEPARKDGVPVPVQINIEVNFQLGPGPAADAQGIGYPDITPGTGIYRVGSPGVSAPLKISGDQPSYTEDARQRKIQGMVILTAVVAADGSVQRVHVQHGLEPLLDQRAVDTIKTWRFRPATKDGQPVAVLISIETNFRLY